MYDKLCRDTVGLPSGRSPILHQMVWLGMFQGGWNSFAAQRNKLSCRPTLGVNYTQLAPDEKSCGSWRISVTPKASAGCKSTLAFGSSHEARRRMAAFSIQLTRKPHRTSEPRGPSPSGGISQSIHMSPYAPARPRRSPGVKGYYPLREPRGPSPSGGIFAANSHVSLCPCAPQARSPGSRGTTPCARPVAERRYFAANSHVSLCPCAPAARSPGSRGTTPCASRKACRRAAVFRSQLTCLPMPLRAAGAQSERGTQSPILPRTMKRAPSKV